MAEPLKREVYSTDLVNVLSTFWLLTYTNKHALTTLSWEIILQHINKQYLLSNYKKVINFISLFYSKNEG